MQQNSKNYTELFFVWLINNRWYVVVFFGFIALFGSYSLSKIKIDAIPDITNKQVIVNTKAFGIDPVKLEKSITYPIESELYGLTGLSEMRSLSRFGLSQIILIFGDEVNIQNARNEVLQRLSSLGDKLPPGINPTIAPLTTGIGEILIYQVVNPKADQATNQEIAGEPEFTSNKALQEKSESGNESSLAKHEELMNLRTIQEFRIARELKKVRGVAEVDTIGGYERQLHLNINPQKITQFGLTEKRLIEQINGLGESFGGGYIEKDDKQKIVRTAPNIGSFEDVMKIPVKIDYNGRSLPLSEIVEVKSESSQRLGAAIVNGQEAVIGTVMLQSGKSSQEVLTQVKAEIARFNKKNSDVQIEILYDRQFLINATIKTVMRNLIEGILLVIGVLCLILGNLRIGLTVASSLLFCIFLLAICMNIFGISANLMSLGAIDFGILVDSSVVLVEYFVSKTSSKKIFSPQEKTQNFAVLTTEMLKPISVGILIIALVYVPILLFSGIEGKTFRPMAINVVIAMLASLFTAFLLMPVLSYFFVSNQAHHESKVFNKICNYYSKLLSFALNNGRKIIFFCIAFFIGSASLLLIMASDFLPNLNEGDLVYTIVAPEGTSLSKTIEFSKKVEEKLKNEPEIDKVFVRIGSSQSGLDPMPQSSADLFVILKEERKSLAHKIAPSLLLKAKQGCNLCEITYTQPIAMRFNEMLEGSRADLSLRIFGENLTILMEITKKVSDLLKQQPQVLELGEDFINSIRSGYFVDVKPDYQKIVRHQVRLSDINHDLSNAMAGFEVGRFYGSEFPISIILHLSEKSRDRLRSIESIPVALPDGGSFPLSNVALIAENRDFVSIPRLFGKRYSALSIYLKDTDYEGFIKKSEGEIKQRKILPEGYELEWGGRFENFNNAKRQIYTVIPLMIAAIFFLLFKMFKKFRLVAVMFSSVPFAVSGGVLMLFLCKIPITISVYVGFIALIGISLLNSIILLNSFVSYQQNNSDEKNELVLSLKSVCIARLRPILMTAITASLGFLPMAFGHGIGAEVQQPIAITVIGGIISSTIATLILTPVLLARFGKVAK